jgi:hypothetical protein
VKEGSLGAWGGYFLGSFQKCQSVQTMNAMEKLKGSSTRERSGIWIIFDLPLLQFSETKKVGIGGKSHPDSEEMGGNKEWALNS